MGQTESTQNDEQLLSSNSNGFHKGKKISQKASLKNELDNVSAGSGESNDDIVNALEDALDDSSKFSNIPVNELQNGSNKMRLTEEEERKLREDLQKAEEDIAMYKQSLQSRINYAGELRRRLGLTIWDEFSKDVSKSFRTIKESQTYQKTEGLVQQAGDNISKTFDQLRSSAAVKSLEEKVGNAYVTVKAKLPKQSVNLHTSNRSKSEKEPILSDE